MLLYGLVRFLASIFPFSCLGFSHFLTSVPLFILVWREELDSSLLAFNNFPFLIRKWVCCLFSSHGQHLFVLQSPSKFILALDG